MQTNDASDCQHRPTQPLRRCYSFLGLAESDRHIRLKVRAGYFSLPSEPMQDFG